MISSGTALSVAEERGGCQRGVRESNLIISSGTALSASFEIPCCFGAPRCFRLFLGVCATYTPRTRIGDMVRGSVASNAPVCVSPAFAESVSAPNHALVMWSTGF